MKFKNDLYMIGLVGIAISSLLCAQPAELIKSVTITKHRVEVKVNDAFKKAYLRDDFFAEYDTDIDLTKLDRSIVLMPFFMNVLSAVWASGDEYYIEAMDAQLYESLQKVQRVFKRIYPHTNWSGKLIPKKLVHNKRASTVSDEQVALMFSGGLDSIASSLYHREKKQLLITARGHFDMPLHKDPLWEQMRQEIVLFAQQHGHRNAFVRSNYWDIFSYKRMNHISSEIINWHTQAIEGLGWAGLAAPILVSKGYSLLLVASSVDWNCPYPHAANPLIDDAIIFADVHLQHDMFDFTRVDKQEYVADYYTQSKKQKPFVKVCQLRNAGASNCSKCEKCLRTINGFIVVGQDHQAYGFPISYEEAIKRLRYFYTNGKTTHLKAWHLRCMQTMLHERAKRGQSLSPYLSWFVALDLDAVTEDTRTAQHTVNWRDVAQEFNIAH